MATFTLDDIRTAADAKYGNTEIDFGTDTLVLRNVLRLTKEERKALASVQTRIEEGEDEGDLMIEALRLVSKSESTVNTFLAVVDNDMAVLAQVFQTYTEGTQVGEASASQS